MLVTRTLVFTGKVCSCSKYFTMTFASQGAAASTCPSVCISQSYTVLVTGCTDSWGRLFSHVRSCVCFGGARASAFTASVVGLFLDGILRTIRPSTSLDIDLDDEYRKLACWKWQCCTVAVLEAPNPVYHLLHGCLEFAPRRQQIESCQSLVL